MPLSAVGESIPAHTAHAVSVSLPTWKANVAYEEGESWVVDNMKTGYPRFYIHKLIKALAAEILKRWGKDEEDAMLFPSCRTAQRCVEFMLGRDSAIKPSELRIIDLVVDPKTKSESLVKAVPTVSAVLFPKQYFPVAKQYWQHSGDGVSSRRAEFCHRLLQEGFLVEKTSISTSCSEPARCKGPRRYQKGASVDLGSASKTVGVPPADQKTASSDNAAEQETSQYVEERFGRNLDVSLVEHAKSAIKRRIAGSLQDVDLAKGYTSEMDSTLRGVSGLSEEDVYLFPCGMNAIFNAHQLLLKARGPMKSISFGFPYIDTLKILEKWGPGCLFYGNGSSADLDDLEKRLEGGERFLALFAEFPGNPLLTSPDMQRIRKLSLKYDFAVVIDETIGNFINVHVLPYADVVVSSLTKIFTGECNVMGGSGIFNPQGPYTKMLKETAAQQYEDNYWAEDALFMERNSRDFVSRVARINRNAEAICDVLRSHALVKEVFYPKYVESRQFYDACKTPEGGYGGLLSVVFHQKEQAVAFFDCIDTAKGPSLGTNFTLTSPYVILAHYGELEWAKQYGVDPNLIRISVGLEETEHLRDVFKTALKAAESV